MRSRGTNCTESIEDTPNARKNIEGSVTFKINETMRTDQRAHVVDKNLEG